MLGKIYPSCSSGWYEKEEDMKLTDVKPQLYYRAGEEVEAAVKSAKLVWAKGSEEEEEGGDTPSDGGDTPTPTPDPSGDDEDENGGGGTVTPTPGGDNGGGGFDSGD